jgi:hypothetical protein
LSQIFFWHEMVMAKRKYEIAEQMEHQQVAVATVLGAKKAATAYKSIVKDAIAGVTAQKETDLGEH